MMNKIFQRQHLMVFKSATSDSLLRLQTLRSLFTKVNHQQRLTKRSMIMRTGNKEV